MTELCFNPSQRQALDLSRHVALTAAAGSGKTTVLVERFLRILEKNDYQPGQIVAITFTEEAATEMRDRIRCEVSARAAQQAEGDESNNSRQNPWLDVEQHLGLAKITTIHGFCLSLLKEYPLEAGLNPDFQILPPGEQEAFLWEAVQNAVRLFSRTGHESLRTILEYMPGSKLENILLEMLRRRNYLKGIVPGSHRIEKLKEIYRSETVSIIRHHRDLRDLRLSLSQVPAYLLMEKGTCALRCRNQLNILQHQAELSEEEFVCQIIRSLEGRISPTKQWKSSSHFEGLKEVWSRLKKTLKSYPLEFPAVSPQVDGHFCDAITGLQSLFLTLAERYEAAKKERNILDFEDLLEKAGRLLTDAGVVNAVRRRYRYFLVDEFQDTNSLQWEIIEPLIGPDSNLFAVGDIKQSIYRFRDADVTVFGQVQGWMKEHGRCVDMPENYRSLPQLVQFSNRVFVSLLRGELPFEAQHQEMKACRPGAEVQGKVSTYFYEKAAVTHSEPVITAAWVRHLIDAQGTKPEEIAILLRARTRLKDYESSFAQAGIPYETVGGIGFYERQEVLDLLNLLRFLADPEDDISLIGTLRSPLFSFSDEDLFYLSLEQGNGYWDKLQNSVRTKAAQPAHWKFSVSCLKRWLVLSEQLTLSETLHKAFRDTGYLEVVRHSIRGRQNLANVQKLLETARTFERQGRRSIREFLRFVDHLIGSGANEPESLGPANVGEAVRIFTIHGAKGLQFPVVLIPELGTPFSSGPSDRFYCENLGSGPIQETHFACKIWNPDDGYSELAHPAYEMIKRLDKYRQIAEEKRLLYVATTRAQDQLILIGNRTNEPSYSRWLEQSIGNDYQMDIAPGLSDTKKQSEARIKIPEVDHPSYPIQPPPVPASRPFPAKTHWTPTEISVFQHCPWKYYLSSIEVLSEDGPCQPDSRGQKAALIGSAVHEILEIESQSKEVQRERLVALRAERLAPLFPGQEESIRNTIERHLDRVTSSAFYRRIRQAVQVYSEKQFHLRFRGRTLRGIMDRLFQESDGRWIVVDFKTNQLRTEDIQERVWFEGYDLQLELYLWAVSQILSSRQVEGVLFFTHTGDLVRFPLTEAVDIRCRKLLEGLPDRIQPELFPKTDRSEFCQACGFFRGGICGGNRPRQKTLWGDKYGT